MTDQERDPEATGPEGATDGDAAVGGSAAETDTETDTDSETDTDTDDAPGDAAGLDQIPEPEAWTVGAEDPELGAAAAAPASAAAAGKDRGGAKGTGPKQAQAAPSVASEAVKVSDRASAIFVIAVVAVFVAILAWGLIGGKNGFLGSLMATPPPVETVAPDLTAEPSVPASEAPSAPAPASVAPSTAPSPEPSAEASVTPSAAASTEPSVEPSVAPSEAPPSASPEISPSPAAS